jgi:hypothetical protein
MTGNGNPSRVVEMSAVGSASETIPKSTTARTIAYNLWKAALVTYRVYVDRTMPYSRERWIGFAATMFLYAIRTLWVNGTFYLVMQLEDDHQLYIPVVYAAIVPLLCPDYPILTVLPIGVGYYIVAYAYGIYELNLFIQFLSPMHDPEAEEDDGPQLPTHRGEEFKPFIRRLPEFQFWERSMRSLVLSFFLTFIPLFNIPVYVPILVFYFVFLFAVSMRKQIAHMMKHKYVPFSIGKKTYNADKKGKGNDKSWRSQ